MELQTTNSVVGYAELDEMHSFIGSKKNIVGYGLLLIDLGKPNNFFIGDRSNRLAFEFWGKIKDTKMNIITSDYRKAYNAIVPSKKLIQYKAETSIVEGYNSLFRHSSLQE